MLDSKVKINEFVNNLVISQFYYSLFAGNYSSEVLKEYIEIEETGIFKLEVLKYHPNFSIDFISELDSRLVKIKTHFVEKSFFKQIGSDNELIEFWRKYRNNEKQREIRLDGIRLYDLAKLFDITEHLKMGFFLQDLFCGYQSKDYFEYRSDCLDILNSAIYYFNEAYDYEIGNKTVFTYNQIDVDKLRTHEFKRIYTAEEVAYKNYRESYINILFFIEAFINAIGYNAILEPNTYSQEQINKLHGFSLAKKNDRIIYSNISTKLQDISTIISGVPIDLRQSPYCDYIKSEVEIRNKYIHSAPHEEKEKLNYSRINWKDKCHFLIESFAIKILEAIWTQCYPQRNFPPYIFNGFYMGTFKGFQSKGVLANIGQNA